MFRRSLAGFLGRLLLLATIGIAVAAPGPAAAQSQSAQAVLERAAARLAAEAPTGPHELPAAEVEIVGLINTLRADAGVPLLLPDPTLVDLARIRSRDMIERRYFGHDIPGVGYSPNWLLGQVPGALGAGENLGLSNEPDSVVVRSLFDAWTASPGHHANMVRPEFNRVGVGAVEVPQVVGHSVKVITQLFTATP
jgi:uncharacterized protein YkwD